MSVALLLEMAASDAERVGGVVSETSDSPWAS